MAELRVSAGAESATSQSSKVRSMLPRCLCPCLQACMAHKQLLLLLLTGTHIADQQLNRLWLA